MKPLLRPLGTESGYGTDRAEDENMDANPDGRRIPEALEFYASKASKVGLRAESEGGSAMAG